MSTPFQTGLCSRSRKMKVRGKLKCCSFKLISSTYSLADYIQIKKKIQILYIPNDKIENIQNVLLYVKATRPNRHTVGIFFWKENVYISKTPPTWPWHRLLPPIPARLTVLQSFCKGQCCAPFGSWQCNTRCELCTLASIIKNASLIFTLLSVASNLMVNKNTASLPAKLFIQPQFKISQLQFFAVFLCSTATPPIVDLFIYVFVFSLYLGVFLFILLEGEGVFPPVFTFHILWNSAFSFPPCDME